MNTHKNLSLFKGLDSLRFFAAFFVVIHHSEAIRKKNGLYNMEWLGLFRNGGMAVLFFFVLSGFLITYLLLKEDYKTGTVNVPDFYLKRILRIWPLYFLLVFIGTIVLPVAFRVLHINYEMPYTLAQTWYYFVFFFPGLVTFYFGHHFLEFLWSIGVEEVFYVAWPLFFRFLRKNILGVLLSVILFKVALMTIAWFFAAPGGLFRYIVFTFSVEAMAIGGLGAYFIYNREKPLSDLFVYKKPFQVVAYALLLTFFIFDANIHNIVWKAVFQTPVVSSLLLDFLFLYLIIGVSLVDHNIIKLQNKALTFLGKISYGIYMYHMLIVFAVVQFLKKYLSAMGPVAGTVVYYSVILLTIIAVAAFSKSFFENYFLKLRKTPISRTVPQAIAENTQNA